MKILNDKIGRSGFSLLELMIVIVILAVGLLGVAGLQARAIKGNSFAMRNSEAVSLIEDRIEAYKNTLYADISEGNETETGLGSNGLFTRKTTVQKDIPVNNTKTVIVEVSWKDSTNHSCSFQTVIAK